MKKAVLNLWLSAMILLLAASGCALFPHPPSAAGQDLPQRVSSQHIATQPLARVEQPATPYLDISHVQQRLLELGFAPGPVDGIAGPAFHDALIAFQKLNNLPRDGQLSEAVQAALATPARPVASLAQPGYHVEADLARQLLTVYNNGRIVRILPISSGNGEAYKNKSGRTVQANTPTGLFRFVRRIRGIHKSYLGELYNPVFFTSSGYAVHGSRQVPPYPASHGCIRIPIRDSAWFLNTIPLGTPFLISAEPLTVEIRPDDTLPNAFTGRNLPAATSAGQEKMGASTQISEGCLALSPLSEKQVSKN
ncbi:MAG: murein L,D-transpeptidase [Candidatus Competibacteraceae bacterium]|nr:murein L,D-transpeptidase [Candidatus Competibacteraceae bacterium]